MGKSCNFFNGNHYSTNTHRAVSEGNWYIFCPPTLASLEWGDCAVFQQVAVGKKPKYIQTIKVKDRTGVAKVLGLSYKKILPKN